MLKSASSVAPTITRFVSNWALEVSLSILSLYNCLFECLQGRLYCLLLLAIEGFRRLNLCLWLLGPNALWTANKEIVYWYYRCWCRLWRPLFFAARLTHTNLHSGYLLSSNASTWSCIHFVLTSLFWYAAENQFDFFFSENGLVAYKEGQVIAVQSLKKFLGDEKLKELISFILHYIADLDIPIKRGTFVEFRNGMLNVSPIGRNCSQEERDEFEQYDLKTGIR